LDEDIAARGGDCQIALSDGGEGGVRPIKTRQLHGNGDILMGSTERIDWSARGTEAEPTAGYASKDAVSTEVRAHCAYNQTRECFLGLEVAAAEYSYASLGERLAKHALKSGEGLWLMPFHGIPTTGLYAPLDLIYLDDDCRVTEAVESFPTFLANSSSPRAASVLAINWCCAWPRRWSGDSNESLNGPRNRIPRKSQSPLTIPEWCKARFC
jgi:hypothetical protein